MGSAHKEGRSSTRQSQYKYNLRAQEITLMYDCRLTLISYSCFPHYLNIYDIERNTHHIYLCHFSVLQSGTIPWSHDPDSFENRPVISQKVP